MFYLLTFSVADRFVTLRSTEASVPGPAGPLVATTTEAAPGPACVEREPAITPPRSAAASRVTGSASRSPTAPGKLFY